MIDSICEWKRRPKLVKLNGFPTWGQIEKATKWMKSVHFIRWAPFQFLSQTPSSIYLLLWFFLLWKWSRWDQIKATLVLTKVHMEIECGLINLLESGLQNTLHRVCIYLVSKGKKNQTTSSAVGVLSVYMLGLRDDDMSQHIPQHWFHCRSQRRLLVVLQ